MIVPSIDLMNGHAVQLIGGKELAIDAGDPRPIAKKFGRVGEIAVIDLDAALGRGSNKEVILDLLKIAPCRVGGGIRDPETALFWLNAGARSVILGTQAVPEVLKHLPKERVMAALDAEHGEVVVQGWTEKTGQKIADRIQVLNEFVSGYLITFVEREGRLGGTNLDQVEQLVELADGARVTIAGGVTTTEDISALDKLKADAQVGMALYSNKLSLKDGFCAPMTEQTHPVLISNAYGQALCLTTSADFDLNEAVEDGTCSMGDVLKISISEDRSSLQVFVRNASALNSDWGSITGLPALASRLLARRSEAPAGSYTRRLFDDPDLLKSKLIEEAEELAEANTPAEIIHEVADVIYFALVAAARGEVKLSDVEKCLDDRALKVIRRPGDAKR